MGKGRDRFQGRAHCHPVHFLFQLPSLPPWGETEAEGLNAHTHEIRSQKIFLSSPCLKGGKFGQEMDNKCFPDLSPSQSSDCQAQPAQLWQGAIFPHCFYYHTSQPSWGSGYVQPGAFRQSGDHLTSKTMLWTVVISHCSENSLDIQEAGTRKRAVRLPPGPSPTSPNQTCLSACWLSPTDRDILLSLQHQGCCFLICIKQVSRA